MFISVTQSVPHLYQFASQSCSVINFISILEISGHFTKMRNIERLCNSWKYSSILKGQNMTSAEKNRTSDLHPLPAKGNSSRRGQTTVLSCSLTKRAQALCLVEKKERWNTWTEGETLLPESPLKGSPNDQPHKSKQPHWWHKRGDTVQTVRSTESCLPPSDREGINLQPSSPYKPRGRRLQQGCVSTK